MKNSYGTKILVGFIINILIVVALFAIYIIRTRGLRDPEASNRLDWIEIVLFGLAIILLVVVYFIIRSQIKLRREADKLLLANRELVLSIINNTSNPISIKKINGEYLLVNQQFMSLFQIESDKIIGKTDLDILPKESAEAYRYSDLEVIKEEKEIKIEEKIMELDGEHTYLSVKFPLFDSENRIYAVGSIGTDITERKSFEKSLKDSETFFKMSLEIMVIANKEKLLKINPTLSKVLGYTNKELLEKPFKSFIYPADHEKTDKEINSLQTGDATFNFENRWVTSDKKIVWLRWIASYDINTGLMYAIAQDITEKKNKEEDLKKANTFFDISHDIMIIGKGDHFIRVNEAFTRILGYEQSEMSDKPILSFFHPGDLEAARDMISTLKKGEPVLNFRVRVRGKKGNYRKLDWTATSDIGSDEIYGVARDVTELVEQESSLLLVNNFFEISLDVFFVLKGTKIIKINPAFTEVTGYTLNDVENMDILELIHSDYKEIVEKRLEKNGKEGQAQERVKYPILCQDGKYKWMETMATTDLKTGLTYMVLRDIDELMKNEEFLKIADTFFDLSLNIMVILTEETFIRVNPTTSKILGYSEAELLAEPFTTYIYPDDVALTLSELEKLNNNSAIIDFRSRWVCKDTSVKWLSWTFTIDPAKKTIYGVAKDITEQLKLEEEEKRALQQLQENEIRLKLIMDNIGDGVIVANEDRKIILANALANDLFGEEENEYRSANLSDKYFVYNPIDESVFPAQHLSLSKAFEGESTDDVDVVLVNRDSNEKKRVLLSGRPLVDNDNNIVAAVVTIKDITKYKRLEEQLEKTEDKLKTAIGFKK